MRVVLSYEFITVHLVCGISNVCLAEAVAIMQSTVEAIKTLLEF